MTRRLRFQEASFPPPSPDAPLLGDEPDLARIAELAELGISAGSLIHEIRQPLFAAKGTLELARAEGRSPTPEELTTALEELRHIEALLEAHGGLGRRDDPPEAIDLLAMVHRTCTSLSPRARHAGVDLVVEGEVVLVRARSTAVRQVLLNLLGNALDAVDGRARRRVELRVDVAADTASVRVSDTGPGIDPEVLARLFEPFVTTKPPGRGTGLGLWVAHGLIVEAGGTLRAVRSDASGTVMEAVWPLSGPGAAGGSASS
ncbi:MAG: HAMP domain-containing histidine kinase [Alphaproteobacteria bacterium]|nr:HAMP domain-containing histidine kinase [Alphaproteobacteria bacterium]